MIELHPRDSIFNHMELIALVNPVNTVGVSGAGLAMEFKERFPDNFKFYQNACHAGKMVTGRMLVYTRQELFAPHYIINFPTKAHYSEKTRPAYIENGLEDLARVIDQYQISSIGIPALGCDLGGLQWKDVFQIIKRKLRTQRARIVVFPPLKIRKVS